MFSFRIIWLAVLLQVLVAAQNVDFNSRCRGLTSLSLEHVTILSTTYTPANSNVSFHEQCDVSFNNSVDVCRVYGMVNTTSENSARFEAWLPDTWYGRYLFVGSGAFGGCVNYFDLDYGTTLHFATIGSDNGHQGIITAAPFLNQPEVLIDYSYRGAHATAIVGQQLVEAYYNNVPSKSYYLGCSAGGRQGVQFALKYPDFFDGIIAGSPAIDWNHFYGWSGMLTTYVGEPLLNKSDKFIPPELWPTITQEVLNQCDGLDGLVDGLIADPDDCHFRPEKLLCAKGFNSTNCLTRTQVDALRRVYSPLRGPDGQLWYPRFDPGAEAVYTYGYPMTGLFPPLTADWFKYAIFNDTEHSFDKFSLSDIAFADSINPADIATWNGDLSAFRDGGKKLLTFHGTRDAAMAHGNSKRFYELISSTLDQRNLDPFYRLFWIPGMSHCTGGIGHWYFGQGALQGKVTSKVNDTAHNILLSLVDWVENDIAPDVIIGVDANMTERTHCRYPHKSRWNGEKYVCK